jgi:hypothetical protein
MAYFPDLAPYAYGHSAHPAVVHVGWLDGSRPFPKGPVESRLIKKMKLLMEKPVERYRGVHLCELCVAPPDLEKTIVPNRIGLIDPNCSWAKWAAQRKGNGEIRVASSGVTFAAPVLIVHYIEEHCYLPPAQFLKAIDEAVG